MTFAFGHLIGAWLLGKVYEYTAKKQLGYPTWFFLILGGILPDVDHFIDWVSGTELHRTLTHSFFFVIAAPLALYLILTILKNQERAFLAYVLASGIMTHLILDFLTSPTGIPLFWPNLTYFSITHIGPLPEGAHSFLRSSPEKLLLYTKLMILDMGFGTIWIFYFWWRKKLSF